MAIHEHEVGIQRETPAELDEIGLVLLRAADLIRRDGWWAGSAKEEFGSLCASLAITHAGGGFDVDQRFADSLGLTNRTSDVYAWNDTPGRTKEEVIEALERAAWGI